jgi:hypothetical protein
MSETNGWLFLYKLFIGSSHGVSMDFGSIVMLAQDASHPFFRYVPLFNHGAKPLKSKGKTRRITGFPQQSTQLAQSFILL